MSLADSRHAAWTAALAEYLAAHHVSEATPASAANADRLVDVQCEAQDRLIEQVRAPDIAAVMLKLRFAMERAQGFEGLFGDHVRGIFADLGVLAAEEADRVAAFVDPHPLWLADRNRIHVIANRWSPMADGLMDALIDLMSVIEDRILKTPATTAQGWAAKAVYLLQGPAEGHNATGEVADRVVHEATALLSVGGGEYAADPAPAEQAA